MSQLIHKNVVATFAQRIELVWQLTRRNVELRAKGSHLGLVWSVINPLIMLALYVFVFGYIFGGSFGHRQHSKLDYSLALFLGLSVLNLLTEILAISTTVIVSQPNFVKKVVFPLEVLPIATVASSFFNFLITLVLIGIGLLIAGAPVGWSIFLLPVVLAPLALMCLGISFFVSSVGVFFRDVGQIVAFVSTALMFASAVFYPVSLIPPAAWRVLRFNPFLQTVEMMRDVMLWNVPVNQAALAYVWVFGIVSFLVGYLAFAWLKPAFADVI